MSDIGRLILFLPFFLLYLLDFMIKTNKQTNKPTRAWLRTTRDKNHLFGQLSQHTFEIQELRTENSAEKQSYTELPRGKNIYCLNELMFKRKTIG